MAALDGSYQLLRSIILQAYALAYYHHFSSWHGALVNNNLSIACRHFAHFAAVIAEAPGQCLRYCFDEGAEPLWPSGTNIPTLQDIPACQHCGSDRRFEFQVRMLCLCCVFERQLTDQSVYA